MRKILPFLVVLALFVPLKPAFASSKQAYQDYLYQLDTYRQSHTEFSVAKNEYLKFKTLTAQTTALDKTKVMLAHRAELLRSYLFVLNEKLNEDTGLTSQSKALYQTLIANEVAFLEKHALLVPSIGSIQDANTVSQQLESHYNILQASIRQIITGIGLGNLAVLSKQYDTTLAFSQNLVNQYANVYSAGKQGTINRWILQITNKRSLYEQKVNEIRQEAANLKGNLASLDNALQKIVRHTEEAKQYLVEGTSYMGELVTALRYQD